MSAGGQAAIEFFNIHPLISIHARRLLESGRTSVRYTYVDQEVQWFLIAIDALPNHTGSSLGRIVVNPTASPFGLTLRELDVLTLLAAGHSNQDIADCLNVKLRTVTTHVEHILLKLGRLSRTAAATLAVDFGLLRLPTPGGGRNLQPLTVGLLDMPSVETKHTSSARWSSPVVPDPLIIGTVLSLKGLSAGDAREMMMGARLAVREINALGGVLGRPLELREVECDVGRTESIVSAVNSLIDAEVDAVASSYSAGEFEVQDLVAKYGAPYIHSSALEASSVRVRNEPDRLSNIFQLSPGDTNYGPRFIDFLGQLEESGQWKPRSRRIVVIKHQWGGMDIGIQRVEQMAARRGFSIDVIDHLPLVNVDWQDVVRDANSYDPCAILLAFYFPEGGVSFLRQYLANPGNALIYKLYGPSVPAYLEELGGAAEGILWSTTTGVLPDPRAQSFANRFRQFYHRSAGLSQVGLAYDRVYLLAQAWQKAGRPRNFKAVNAALRTRPYRGVNGMYFLDNAGQCVSPSDPNSGDPTVSHPHMVFQIQSGEHKLLSPSSMLGVTTFRLPPWLQRT